MPESLHTNAQSNNAQFAGQPRKTMDMTAGIKDLNDFLEDFYRKKRAKLSGQAQPPPPVVIDPQKVAAEARKYMDAERAKGHQVSTTEAVMHVLQQNHS